MSSWDDVDAKLVRFQFQYDSGIPGTFAVIGVHPSLTRPVVLVWYSWAFVPSVIEIQSSWVDQEMRRRGLRSRVNDFLFDSYSSDALRRIVSQTGTPDGEKWMLAVGYKKFKDGHFELTRAQWQRRKSSDAT